MAVRQNTVRKASGVSVPGRSIVEVCKCGSAQVWKSTKTSISVQSYWILVLTACTFAHLHIVRRKRQSQQFLTQGRRGRPP